MKVLSHEQRRNAIWCNSTESGSDRRVDEEIPQSKITHVRIADERRQGAQYLLPLALSPSSNLIICSFLCLPAATTAGSSSQHLLELGIAEPNIV
jgi:hypothetical protein